MDVLDVVLSAVVSVPLSAYVGFRLAKWQMSKQISVSELQRTYGDVSEVLDDYIQWLARLRFFADPINWQPHGGDAGSMPANATAGRLDLIVSELRDVETCGPQLIKTVENARYDLPFDDRFMGQIRDLVASVQTYWRELESHFPPASSAGMNAFDVNLRVRVRHSMVLGQLDAAEVLLAEMVIADLRYQLHHEYKRQVKGTRAVQAYDKSMAGVPRRRVQLRDDVLVYDGEIPFKSAEYAAAKDKTPWEREGAAKDEDREPSPESDATA